MDDKQHILEQLELTNNDIVLVSKRTLVSVQEVKKILNEKTALQNLGNQVN